MRPLDALSIVGDHILLLNASTIAHGAMWSKYLAVVEMSLCPSCLEMIPMSTPSERYFAYKALVPLSKAVAVLREFRPGEVGQTDAVLRRLKFAELRRTDVREAIVRLLRSLH